MKTSGEKNIYRQSWFGLKATVILGPGFAHRAGFGWFLIPHPPLVNLVLRLGLTDDDRVDLSAAHEFAHLSTAPLAILYTLAMFVLVWADGFPGWPKLLLILISTHAIWEAAAEIIAATSDIKLYDRCYEGVTPLPRMAFWLITAALTIMGWFVFLI